MKCYVLGVETVPDPSIHPLSEAARINTLTATSKVGSIRNMATTAEALGTQDATTFERNTKIDTTISVTKSTSRGAGTTAGKSTQKASKTTTAAPFISTKADKMNRSRAIEGEESKSRMNGTVFVTASTTESGKSKSRMNTTLFVTGSTMEGRKSRSRMHRMNRTLFTTASTYGTTTKESERSRNNTDIKDRTTEKGMTKATASIGGLEIVTSAPVGIENVTKEGSMRKIIATEMVHQLTTRDDESHKEQHATTSSTASTTMGSKEMLTDKGSINGGFTKMKMDEKATVGDRERTMKMTSKSSKVVSDDSMAAVTTGDSREGLKTTRSKDFSTDVASSKHTPTPEKFSKMMTVKSSKSAMPEGTRSSTENVTPGATTAMTAKDSSRDSLGTTAMTAKDNSRDSLGTMTSLTARLAVSSTQKVPKTERFSMLKTVDGKEETTTTRGKRRNEEITFVPTMKVLTIADKRDESTARIVATDKVRRMTSTYSKEGMPTSHGMNKKKALSSTSSLDAGQRSDSKPLSSRGISSSRLFLDESTTLTTNYTSTFGANTGTPMTTSRGLCSLLLLWWFATI